MSRHEDRRAAKAHAQAAIDAATDALAHGNITQSQWYRAVTDALGDAYLAESDPRWQSGFDGDSELWREARAFLLDAIPHSGSFLDVGAANGHLVECLAAWARERDIALDVFGLELNPRLAAEARRRLPALAHQIYTGNIIDWEPPLSQAIILIVAPFRFAHAQYHSLIPVSCQLPSRTWTRSRG